MSWYSCYREAWKGIIETVAAEKHRATQMIEKDTIQSLFLQKLSETDMPFVFKGGTSLSKAYGLIDRFSEDIDLSMSKKPTESERKKTKNIIMRIADELGLTLINPDNIQSGHSYNKYVFEYESLFSSNPLELIVETSFYQKAYPFELHHVNSIVGKFCDEHIITLPIPFKAASFIMAVQTLERSLIDKVFAICDYRVQGIKDRESRHLYDIAKLMSVVTIDQQFVELIDEVREDRIKSKNNPSAQHRYDIHVILKEIIDSRYYETDYKSLTMKLLYEEVSYEEAVNKGIALLADMDIFVFKG